MEQKKTKKPYEPAEILTTQFAMEDMLAFSNNPNSDNEGTDLEDWGL